MLKASELRIGNIVYHINDITRIYSVDSGGIIHWHINDLKINKESGREQNSDKFILNPIPLTEEILLKCGFERYKTYLFRKRINDDFYLIFSPKDTRPLYCILRMYNDDMDILQECNNSVDCNYLHQLQNLYFALTNEELTVKL
jgi:hypothetical protein